MPARLARLRKAEAKAKTTKPKGPSQSLASFLERMESKGRTRRSRVELNTMSAFTELQLKEDARRAQWAKEDKRAAKAMAAGSEPVAAAADPAELSHVGV